MEYFMGQEIETGAKRLTSEANINLYYTLT